MRSALLFTAALSCALLASCRAAHNYQDPTVILHTSGGSELGVSTAQGVVFLGRTARSGEVDITVWFGDGPSIEASIIEPLGDGLFLAQGEIMMPTAEIAFPKLSAKDRIFARGRRGSEAWEIALFPANDPNIEGMIFRSQKPLPNSLDQTGAGVFWHDPDSGADKLIGLVSGTVQCGENGPRYITAIAGKGLWRLVAHSRDSSEERPSLYRDDIL